MSGSDEDAPYFCFTAALRIFGRNLDLEGISRRLGLEPTQVHREGERRGPRSPVYEHDMWLLDAPLHESEPLERHLEWLYSVLRPHFEYLKDLKRQATVDVFCGYRSNSGTAGFQVSHEALRLFAELEVPFGVSVIVIPDDEA